MTILKSRLAARALGLGLLAASLGAPATLAGSKGFQCPFTSKDVDGLYKEIGLDGGSAEAGDRRNTATCTTDESTYATLEQGERSLGARVVDGETVQGVNTDKQILVHVHAAATGIYEISLTVNGAAYVPATSFPLSGSLDTEALADCIAAVTSSQSYTRWACPKK